MIQLKTKLNHKISIHGPFFEKADLCEPILRMLPEWFGQEEANLHYLDAIDRLPTFLAVDNSQETVLGFLTIYQHFPKAAEIYITGVHPDYHRQGIGRALLQFVENYLRTNGVEYLQVKTLSESHPDEGYAKTRAFYDAVGFTPLEEVKKLWNEANPALILIKRL
jgi:ribosomal protein S18 acetylase RimI-like enzyme